MSDLCGIVETMIQTNVITGNENDEKNAHEGKLDDRNEDINATSSDSDQKKDVGNGKQGEGNKNSNEDDRHSNSKTSGKIATVSDLSDLSRKICVVTTAGLPWRTGTAVNPLARALYLTRGRPKHSVILMIPWLETKDEQAKVYGSNVFDSQEEQKIWIQTYCRERILENESIDDNDNKVNRNDEVDNLQIKFYPAKYHAPFGSIFATVDICSLIPKSQADVAILEEPEHLTWFRVPSSSTNSSDSEESTKGDRTDENRTDMTTLATKIMDSNESTCAILLNNNYDDDDNGDEMKKLKELEEQAVIGWTAKFSYVVGILHTNYSAYMKQYGLGTSIVTASAIQALSSICVRAYTHRLIRLSGTLPELDQTKEITCNVHGVRSEFFVVAKQEGEHPTTTTSSSNNQQRIDGGDGDHDRLTEDEDVLFEPHSIYFIGKIIWAKGFDKILEIEDLFRKKTGEYFPIDVYGTGSDFDAISRAFLGRSGLARVLSSESVKSVENDIYSGSKSPKRGRSKSPIPKSDKTAALLFSREGNLRGQIEEGETIPTDSLVVEVQTSEQIPEDSNTGTPSSARRVQSSGSLSLITHLKETTFETKTGVTKAIAALSGRITNLGLHSLYSEHDQESTVSDTNNGEERESFKFKFDPPKSRYELRRHPVPARFLGVKDHALLRDIPQHKILINLSITEVLCTTTAEALAMGKFVIIPEHPSNTFFLQFPNCLSFKTKLECVEKIKYALESNSVPLSSEHKYDLSWEGANLRLYDSSAITEAEAESRNKKTGDFARMHMDTMKTGAFLQGLVHRGKKQHSTD